ncbi:hypothetical protein V1227_29865 [Lentzea sp. DG1S-22]|uniref:hypothetical protein n=1 Tax=Lentzea sp. DG1S-22 TaxID=3108822 RepID=UPI002E7782F6|nr:hypothetical protein [Lentzea sp. DG1S-22]WVH79220.1 hypothetical protein V1227_29865 [Lentzea sp. DG1S-22]
MSKYWLLEWMDVEGIGAAEGGARALRDSKVMERLLVHARKAHEHVMKPIPEAYQQIVAGTGVDLSGTFDCVHNECIKKKVDELIRRTWHYFDKVVAVGLDPAKLFLSDDSDDREHLEAERDRLIYSHMIVALYIREIGAEQLLVFTPRPPYCLDHLDEKAKELGLVSTTPMLAELQEFLRDGCKIKRVGIYEGRQTYSFTHPRLRMYQTQRYDIGANVNQRRELEKWVEQYSRGYANSLLSDAMIARINSAALGRVAIMDSEDLPTVRVKTTVEDAAFNLSLPYVENLDSKELLAVREHEAADFQAFQIAIRKAIKVRIDSIPDADAEQVASDVIDDVIEPALIELNRKMSRAVEVLERRSLLAIGVSVTLTTVGLLAFAPLVGPGIIVGAGGLIANYNDFLKDKKEVKLSDMHFLWRIANR